MQALKFLEVFALTEEAIKHLCIVKGVLGDEWMTNELFRIGKFARGRPPHAPRLIPFVVSLTLPHFLLPERATYPAPFIVRV